MTEIERKFLVSSTAFIQEAQQSYRITQGYLSTDPERTVRVRIKGNKGYLTIKGKSYNQGTTRVEVEEEITLTKAETLLKLSLLGVIDKTRYEVAIGGHLWEVDVFHGKNEGLLLAEIELDHAEAAFLKPDWIGEEVTNQKEYYNAYLSQYPFVTW